MPASREDLGKYYDQGLKKLKKMIPNFDSEHVETHLNVIRTADMVWKALSAYLRPYGLTPPAMGALIHLYTAGKPTPMGRISEQMVVTQANVTGIVDTLEKAGLVERVPHQKDRRVTLISITPAGNKKIKSFLPGQMKLIRAIYGEVPKKERSALRRTLKRIRERVKGLLALTLLFWAGSAAAEPLTLKSAVETALRQTHQLAAERTALDSALSAQWSLMARYDVSLALSVQRLDEKTPPAVFFQVPRTLTASGSASLAKRFSPGTQLQLASALSRASDFPGSTFTLNPRASSSLDLFLTQPLLKGFVGLPERASLRASEIAVQSALAGLDRAAELLAQRTTASYWEFWRSRRDVAVLQASEKESREFLSTTRKLMKRFEAEQDDLLRAEASLLQKQLEVLEASERVAERIEDLRENMNAEAGELRDAELSTPMDPDGIPVLAEALARALVKRRDLAAERLAAEADRMRLRAAAGLGLPSLDLTGQYGWSGLQKTVADSLDQLGRLGLRKWGVGLQFSYAFGARKDKAERLGLESAQAFSAARTLSTRLAIEREVANAVRRLALAGKRVRISRKLEKMQSEVLRLTRRKYRLGRVTSRERLEASNAALSAQSARLKAEAGFASSLAAERAAEGGLLAWLGIDSSAYQKAGR